MKAYPEIGQKIHKAREECGISQEELAKQLGCSQASLSYYELGKRRIYFEQLKKISDILDKPIVYFLEENQQNSSDEESLNNILMEQHLKDILLTAHMLSPTKRKAVLEFIEWQKTRA